MDDAKETNLHNSCKHGHFTIYLRWCRPPVIRMQYSLFWPSQVQHQHQQQQQTHQHHHHHLHRHYLNITKKVVFRFKVLLKCDVLLFSGAVMSDCSVIRPSTFQIFWSFHWKKHIFGLWWCDSRRSLKGRRIEDEGTSTWETPNELVLRIPCLGLGKLHKLKIWLVCVNMTRPGEGIPWMWLH